MSLIINSLGDNPQSPGTYAETYIPDQLIAGNLKLVSDSALITGGAALQRGSVLGKVAFGSLTSSAGKTFASGSVVVAALPVAGDTVTIGGTVITFVAANPVGNQVAIGATVAATADNLAAFLIGSLDANLIKFTYSVSNATVTLTAAALGTAGNSLTLATSDATAFTVSGATLSGGTANAGIETIGTLSAGAALKPGNYTITLTSATAANVVDPSGNLLGVATVGTQFTDQQISFLITTGTGIAAGDLFVIAAAVGSGGYKLASAAATDGSQIPRAILADYSDASTADVTGGIYIMGEFNANAMTFGPGITIAAAKAALAPLGIFVKTSVSAADPS
jgi:hypothetical protein